MNRDRELDSELQSHLEQSVRDHMERGLSRADAEAAARREFGNLGLVKEVTREMWGSASLERLLQDVRYGARNLWKSPGFTAIAVLTLALGIGANSAMFSLMNQLLLRDLGMPHSEQLVMLWARNPSRSPDRDLVAPAIFNDWRSRNHTFSDMGYAADHVYTLTGRGEPQSLVAWSVSPNFMSVLGARPIMGRTFAQDEAQPGKNHLVLLAYTTWRNVFAGDPAIVGKSVTLDDNPYTVVGVMPRGFNFPSDKNDIWTLLVIPASYQQNRTARALRAVGRIRDGVTLDQAQQDMAQLSRQLGAEHPDTDQGWIVDFQPVRDLFSGDVRRPIFALMGAVGFLLLIVCANLATLLLVRAAGRKREFAVRVALGASRTRIARQLLTESLMLAAAGCAAGLLLAAWGSSVLVGMFPSHIANLSIPRVQQIPVDSTVVLFSVMLAAFTALFVGLLPAFQLSGVTPEQDLKDGDTRAAGGRRSRQVRSALVVTQISLALVLLVCAGLMIKSFQRLRSTALGFNPDHVLTMDVFLPASRYKSDADRSRFVRDVLQQIDSLPGVQSAAAVNTLPLSGFDAQVSFTVSAAPASTVAQWPVAAYRIVSEDYLRTLQIPLLRGRAFRDPQDTAQSPAVCIINQALARAFFGNDDPVGRVLIPDPGLHTPPWLIVGVVGDVKHSGAAEAAVPEVYRPFAQVGFPLISFTVRTSTEPLALADSVRKAIWSVDRQQVITRVLTMDEAASESSALRRLSMGLFLFFALTALLLASLGIYGVVSHSVATRTRELGIRLALGAQPAQVLRLIVRQSLWLAVAGLSLGLAAALAATRFLAALLFQVRPVDPVTFAVVPLLLGAVSLMASYIPARRATKVDPTVALRYE